MQNIDGAMASLTQKTTDEIGETLKTSGFSEMDFPYCSDKAINEFDPEVSVFAMAFPWLYPGGVGDVDAWRNTNHIPLKEWLKKMIQYEDCRFARDKMWCFYALNYFQRQQNNDQGGFYVKSFYDNGPKNLDDIKEEIRKGNLSWIDKLTYFGNRITGSDSYWRSQRDTVYSWINFHCHMKHGLPNYFITLSCAEYHWPDIKRLVKERCKIGGIEEVDWDLETEIPSRLINELTVVIQEYFQARVSNWIHQDPGPTLSSCYYSRSTQAEYCSTHQWSDTENSPHTLSDFFLTPQLQYNRTIPTYISPLCRYNTDRLKK